MQTIKDKDKEKDKLQKRLSQFQWFQIQTKVRQTVYQLMQPFQKRQVEQFSKLHQMRKSITEHGTTIKQHAFLLGSQEQNITPAYVNRLEQEISTIQSSVLTLELSTKESINNFNSRLVFFEEKTEQFNEILTSFEMMRREKITDKEQMVELLNRQIQSLTETVTNHEMETASIVSMIKARQHQVDQQILDMQNKFRQYEGVIRSANSSVETLKKDFKGMGDRQFEDRMYIENVDVRLNQLETDKELSKKFMGVVDEINNGVMFITNYIDKYLPLFIQAQLSDTLGSFVTDRQRKALCVYEEKAFENFNKIIIANESDGLADNIRRYVNTVEQIILKNKKYTISLKVDRKAKLGDMRSGKEYDIHKLEEYAEDQKGVAVDTIVSQDKVKRIVQSEWQQLSDNINLQLQKMIESNRSQIEQFEAVYDKKYLKLTDQIQQLQKTITKVEINNGLTKKHLQNENQIIENILAEFKKQIQEQRIIARDLINFCSILNHVVIQDQLDRQGIALFGLKETTKGMKEKNQSTLGLDSKCLGCSGYPASTLSAFKMACLAYNPSSITVDGNVYRREQILDISTRLLENTKQRFEGSLEGVGNSIDESVKLSARNEKSEKMGIEKTITLNAFNTLEIESRQVLPSIKSKRSNHTSLRRRSVHQSFYNPLSSHYN